MSDETTGKIKFSWPEPGSTITAESGMIYIIGKHISSGGYALVFEGEDLFGNSVALKVFKPANRPFNEVQEQWNKETQLFKKLRHPNIVAIYDAFICENLFYIILEKAWGNLLDWVQIQKPLDEANVSEIARQLLFAINFIHREKVLQRDITIFNTLVFEGPESKGATFKITDFGISKEFFEPFEPLVYNGQTAHPLFTPPELLLPQYGYANEQTDLYHLGLVLLYTATGTLPFNPKMKKEEIDQIILNGVPREEAEKIGTTLGDFIARLLRRRQEYRFQTALDAWKNLRNLMTSEQTSFDFEQGDE